MTPQRTPLIIERSRTSAAIVALIERRLEATGFGPPGDDALRQALVHIAARYGELLVEHLNAAPDRHRDAFLSRLGGTPAPALPAQVMLSFKPAAAGSVVRSEIVVPAHTPVAAPPAPGDDEAVVFETLADLELVRAQPERALVVDPPSLRHADVGDLLRPAGFDGADLLAEAVPLEPACYIALPAAFELPALSRITVEVQVLDAGTRPPGTRIEWAACTKQGLLPLAVESDSSLQLSRSGTIVLTPPPAWPRQAVAGCEAMWLVCRLLHDAPAASAPDGARFVSPRLAALRIGAGAQAHSEPAGAACFGSLPLDISKDFFPLGERPRFGDVFQLMAPAFAQPGARITLALRMTNPQGLNDGPLPPVDPAGKPRVKWEAHTARGWVRLEVEDGTRSFTHDGELRWTVPADVLPVSVAGKAGPWLRARLVSGHYGAPQTVDGIVYPAAPSIAGLLVQSQVELAPVAPPHLVRHGVFEYARADIDGANAFTLFALPDVDGPALYVALASQEVSLRGRTLSWQVQPAPPVGRIVCRDADTPPDAPRPRWQARSAQGWVDCPADDGTAGFTRPGLVRVHLNQAMSMWPACSVDAHPPLQWLRIVWPPAAPAPRLHRLVLNAVQARQTLRLTNEVLGSSTGRPGQSLTALRTPIVGDVLLEVRETADRPDGVGGTQSGAWVRWHGVADFSGSDNQSRHFTLDRRSGCVSFGDGRQGRIPPAGANNIRLREYHAGGGRRGNRPAGAIAQLRTTVPYVESVTHAEPAVGGQDGGDAVSVRRAASAWLRHRDRAVCIDDYAELACAASPEVARAHGHAACDLTLSPRGPSPGRVSVVVVPHGDTPRPQPAPDLLSRVKAYLDARRPVTTELIVLGPEYVGVSVTARVSCVAERSAHEIAAECRRRVAAFLHPVHGGAEGRGWAPGQRPHRSDLLALVAEVDGVDHVDELHWQIEPLAADDALVCAGAVEVQA